MNEFHLTQFGARFFNGQLPQLIKHIGALSTKQTACNLIAAGIHSANEGMTPDGAARIAIETYDAIEKRLS